VCLRGYRLEFPSRHARIGFDAERKKAFGVNKVRNRVAEARGKQTFRNECHFPFKQKKRMFFHFVFVVTEKQR
jgi:hypothetical protein